MNLVIWIILSIVGTYSCGAVNAKGIELKGWGNFSQVLDHFANRTTASFRQRFYAISKHYKEGGPIFLMVGGQEPLTEPTIFYTLIHDTAKLYNGYFVYLEHRYYGQSLPFSAQNLTTENLQWLTVDQSLADITDFIEYLRYEVVDDIDARIILNGWLYGGSLAVWYHHLNHGAVTGVWASTAPLIAQIDFSEYLEFIGNVIREEGGNECFDRIHVGMERVEKLFEDRQFSQLEEEFAICNATELDAHIRVFTLKFVRDYSAYLRFGLQYIIGKHCAILNSHSKESALSNLQRHLHNGTCLDIHPRGFEAELLENNNKAWAYQLCSGLGWIPNTSSQKQPFGTQMPVELFYGICENIFGPKFTRQNIDEAGKVHNKKFGGLQPNVTNVLFTTGNLSPRSLLVVRRPLNEKTFVVNLDEGELWDRLPIFEHDEPQQNDAKEKIQAIIGKLLDV